ncbi:MAG TPA: hypothetical protein VFI31_20065 [Pirellulales bacterium]|nr:hypothetical protein [Pirellulales bacterium]
MPQYLLTAQSPAGRKVTELITAETAKAAVKDLEGRGYKGVVLHLDFIRPIQATPLLTARDLVHNRFRSSLHRTLIMAMRAYMGAWKLLALTVTCFIVRRAVNAPWGLFDHLLIGALFVPLAVVRRKRAGTILYHRMLEAECWRRSDEVLRILPRLAEKLPPYAAAWHRAKAVALKQDKLLARCRKALGLYS